jgi:hypothetical protein
MNRAAVGVGVAGRGVVIDLATRHIGKRTNIEVETVEIVEVVRMRGALGRRRWWRWSVGHGCGAFMWQSSIRSCIGENPERAIPVALGVALVVSSALDSVDATAVAIRAGGELSNWRYCFNGLSTMRNSEKNERIFPGGNKVFWGRIGAFYPSDLFLVMAKANS